MAISLGMIAVQYGCELHGDPDVEIHHLATLDDAGDDALTFLANRAYLPQLKATRAAAVILKSEDVDTCPVAALVADDPYGVYAHVARMLYPEFQVVPGVDVRAVVGDGCSVPASCHLAAGAVIENGATLGERVYVGPHVVVGENVRIGADSRLLAGVIICHDVRIGERCLIHPAAVIGSDGFGNARDAQGVWTKVPQIGTVVLGDDVEIGANTTIDRGAIGDTTIGDGVHLDNLIQVGHNVRIGEHTAIAALTGIAGSVRIGARCMIGGQTGISGHLEITDDVMLTAGSMVHSSILRPGAYGGAASYAVEIGKWRKNIVRYGQLDEMSRRLRTVENKIKNMAGKPDTDE
jgi:UDP-3-O-[3-hydroxymyristoyl] glucosamine N-acyltransferase